jgi:hypothetical protein
MIMLNDTPEFENSRKNRKDPKRDFTRILRAAKPLWQQVLPNPEKHIARGLIFTTNRGITADLSFNEHRKLVILMIRLRTNNDLSPLQEQSVKKVQSENQGLSFIAFGENKRILKIRSQSVLPAGVLAGAVVPQVIKDAVKLLDDENLRDIVEHSVSF